MIRLCDNMINDDYSKLKYNNKLVNYLKIAYTHLESEGYKVVAYKYNWDTDEKIKIEKFEETDPRKNKWVNYYWIEFEKNEVKYKFSLFYKNFDTSSGNVHVLPGVVQLWESNVKEIDDLNKIKKQQLQKEKKYDELIDCNIWVTLLISEKYSNNIDYKIHYLDLEFHSDIDMIFNLIKSGKENFKSREIDAESLKYYNTNDYIFDYTPDNSKKYPIVKWKCYPSRKYQKYWISYYFSEIDKNGSIFPKYGQVQFWRGIDKKKKEYTCNSASEYEEGKGWKLFYPETSNAYKINGIRNWASNGEKSKIGDLIREINEKNVKSFDPDINIENEIDMKRLDKEFEAFYKRCDIIENPEYNFNN